MDTATESKSRDFKDNPPPITTTKSTTPLYLKFIEFWFFIIQLVVVLCSWRVYFLFTDYKDDNNKENNNDQNNKSIIPPKTFKEKVQYNFWCLLTDSFYMIMLIITCTLFFWRAKQLYTQIKKSDSSKWKTIIWDEFSSGSIEFGSFTVLLLLKWPVIFKVFWYKGTEKEDKSTWAEIFIREFSPETNDKDKNTTGENSKKDGVGSEEARKTLSDEQWKKQFRMDLQNIGFEFGPDGEVSKFPPTEIMEKYQKSNRFRDLILQSGPSKPQSSNDDGPKIVDYVDEPKDNKQSSSSPTPSNGNNNNNNKKTTSRKKGKK